MNWESIFKFESTDFSSECYQLKDLQLQSFINFDNVRKEHWSCLRSVDAIKSENPNKTITFIEFCDLRGEIFDLKGQLSGIKNKDNNKNEFIINRLSYEFLEKAIHSLLILTRYYDINPEYIDYYIIICSSDKDLQKDPVLIDTIKRGLNQKILSKLQHILPKGRQNFFMYISSFIKKINAKQH